jgi:RNA polymerase sigma-70 factor (ECF subfamily)
MSSSTLNVPLESETSRRLAAARRGEEEALGHLLAAYRPYLTVLAQTQISRRLQGKADAGDLVQETFLEAHRHFSVFRGQTDAELSAWLRGILAGVIANHVRRYIHTKSRDARLERELVVELGDTSDVLERGIVANVSTPSQEVIRREDSLKLARALDLLPPHYREVVLLRHIEGLPFAQVAEQMGRTVESVEKLWVRALARLRYLLGE